MISPPRDCNGHRNGGSSASPAILLSSSLSNECMTPDLERIHAAHYRDFSPLKMLESKKEPTLTARLENLTALQQRTIRMRGAVASIAEMAAKVASRTHNLSAH